MLEPFASRSTSAPLAKLARLRHSIFGQHATPRCPSMPRLDGETVLVTGGNAGLGLFISDGLAARGARVLIAARNRELGDRACADLRRRYGGEHAFVRLDLSDLDAVATALDDIAEQLDGRPLDRVVANAAIWPRAYARSAQGHEIAFATNLLGHHLLLRRLLADGRLRSDARVVMVTGDIYILERECTPDFEYEGARGGQAAYSRSKLGVLWLVAEYARRYPQLEIVAAHPGVVATELSGKHGPLATRLRDALLISPEQGAQTPLWCATQAVERGGYYHNTMGKVVLDPQDVAADRSAAARLWDRLEGMITA